MKYPTNRKRKIDPTLPDKFCPHCKKRLLKSNFYSNKARWDELSLLCKECHKKIARINIERQKVAIFVLLGDKCSRCGFSDKRALQIDHKDGGGRSERKVLVSPFKYYEMVLKEGKNKYQILCANCNAIKKVDNNENITSRAVKSR